MRILLFNWQDLKNPFAGGAEVHLHEIFRRIAARGHEVTLFCSSFPGAPEEESQDGVRVVRKGGRSLFNYVVPSEYRRRFRHERYDVVVDDMNKIPFYTPLFVKEPLLGMVLHLFGTSIFRETILPAASYVYAAERLALLVYRQTPMAVISESTKKEMMVHGFEERQLFNVEIAVDVERYRPLGIAPSEVPLVGYLGRIKKYKSVDHLLRAFVLVRKEIPTAQLSVVGDGDGRPALQSLARTLGIEAHVSFTGYLPEDEKIKHINRMHVAVNTSAKEGWGLTVTEANACGVPVIASDVPGLRDAVINGQTGLLYEYGNVSELAGKIASLLRDPQQRNQFATAGLAYARSFSWDRCADKMLSAIGATIEKRVSSLTRS